MIKKILSITIMVFIITSCDMLLSFWVSPVYNIPAARAGWTVDNADFRIIGDSDCFGDTEWPLNWVNGNNTLLFRDYNDGDNKISTSGFPSEMSGYDNGDSPLFYLHLLFKCGFGIDTGIDIDQGGTIPVPIENVYLGRDGETEVNVDYTMDVTTTSTPIASYTLPEPAYLGIDGNAVITELAGSLNIVDFNISSGHDFVSGHAICVFSNTNPAGLLYMVYYHNSGLVSLIYADDVETTETGNYFPDGHYEYIWSVYRND